MSDKLVRLPINLANQYIAKSRNSRFCATKTAVQIFFSLKSFLLVISETIFFPHLLPSGLQYFLPTIIHILFLEGSNSTT